MPGISASWDQKHPYYFHETWTKWLIRTCCSTDASSGWWVTECKWNFRFLQSTYDYSIGKFYFVLSNLLHISWTEMDKPLTRAESTLTCRGKCDSREPIQYDHQGLSTLPYKFAAFRHGILWFFITLVLFNFSTPQQKKGFQFDWAYVKFKTQSSKD